MPKRPLVRLTEKKIGTLGGPRKYAVGYAGLSLLVRPTSDRTARRRWIQKVKINGKQTTLGLGTWPAVSLREAREQAFRNFAAVEAGEDPRRRKAKPPATEQPKGVVPTVGEVFEAVISREKPRWRSPDSERQWRNSVTRYADPLLAMRVDEVTSADVARVLQARGFWEEKQETARRVRARLARTFEMAVAMGHRTDNPAGRHLLTVLPRHASRVKRHHPALHHSEIAGLLEMVEASTADRVTRSAFTFLALTGVRTGEVREMTWDEIDLENAIWTIPSLRTKSGRSHRVPLADCALRVLEDAQARWGGTGWVFPSSRPRAGADRPLSKMAFLQLLRRLDVPATPHGLRTSMRSWCEDTGVDFAVAEAILGHVERNAVVRAYQRSDLLERRRPVMEAWAEYVAPVTSD